MQQTECAGFIIEIHHRQPRGGLKHDPQAIWCRTLQPEQEVCCCSPWQPALRLTVSDLLLLVQFDLPRQAQMLTTLLEVSLLLLVLHAAVANSALTGANVQLRLFRMRLQAESLLPLSVRPRVQKAFKAGCTPCYLGSSGASADVWRWLRLQALQRKEFGGASTPEGVLLLGFRILRCLLAEVPNLARTHPELHAHLTSQVSCFACCEAVLVCQPAAQT